MAVNIGIIGCGQVAHFHVQGLKKTNAKVVALADINRQNAEALAQKTGDVQLFEDYRKMVEQAPIDAVIIGLQNHLHYEALRHAIDHRKAIFCEKPLTADVAESADLVAKTRKSGIVFMMGFMKRYHTGFQRMKDIVGELGRILHAHIRQCIYVPVDKMNADDLKREWWGWHRKPSRGGVLVHSGSHEIDLIRYLIGEPKAITAHFQMVPGLDDMEHYCAATIEMEQGFSTHLDVMTMPYSKYGAEHGGWVEEIEVYCEQGWTRLTNYTWDGSMPPTLVVYRENFQSQETIYTGDPRQWENEMVHFIECVERKSALSPDIVDGYRVDQVIADAYHSGKANRKVDISFKF